MDAIFPKNKGNMELQPKADKGNMELQPKADKGSDKCKKDYLSSCPKRSIEDGTTVLSRPSNVQGLGVYAIIHNYEGDPEKVVCKEGGVHGWLFRKGRIVDTADKTKSNCSRNITGAIQSKGELYYKTCRDMKPQEELLVCYGTQCLKDLGFHIEDPHQPQVSQIKKVYKSTRCSSGFALGEYENKCVIRCKENPVIKVHERVKNHTCQYCKSTILTQTLFAQHEKRCKKIFDLVTTIRGEVSTSKNNSTKNIQCADKNGAEMMKCFRRIFFCHHCNYESKWRSKLITHIRDLHSGERTTKGRQILVQQVRAKTKPARKSVTKFTCDKCVFTTVYKYNLIKHKRSHDAIKPYVCPLCGKSFNSKHQQESTHVIHVHTCQP